MSIRKYPVLAKNEEGVLEVFFVWALDSAITPELAERVDAGMASDPVIMEASDIENLTPGWTFDGKAWKPPVE